jgi:hypothetical protein
MSKFVRGIVVGVSLYGAFGTETLIAQQSPLETAFEQLVQNHAALVNGDQPEPKQVELVAQWVEKNDWRSLGTRELSWLYVALDAEQLDPNHFSARWTGTIQAPVTANFTIEQRRQFHADGALRVTIGGQVVLDTWDAATTQRKSGDFSAAVDDQRYRSQPVALTAGQPLELQVEYMFDKDRMVANDTIAKRLFPMVILEWQANGVPKQIIPDSAYTTASGEPGLTGEYFSDLEFKALVGRRIDSGLQMIWYRKAVYSSQHQTQSEILARCWPLVRDNSYLDSNTDLSATDRDPYLSEVPLHERQAFLTEVAERLLRGVPASSRRELVQLLAARSEQLATLSPYVVAETLSASFPVLDVSAIRDLLDSWSKVRQPAAPRVGIYPRTGAVHFATEAYEPYRDIGSLLAGPRGDALRAFIEAGLVHEDGSPNLTLIYCAAFALLAEQRIIHVSPRTVLDSAAVQLRADFVDAVEKGLSKDAQAEDRLVNWLFAKAYLQEVFAAQVPRPWLGLETLEEAYLHAEDPNVRFRVVQELVGRLISLDRSLDALQWLQGTRFSNPAQQVWVSEMQAKAGEMAQYYENYRVTAAEEQRAASHASYLAELRRRIQEAADRGDEFEVTSIRQLIAELENQAPQ